MFMLITKPIELITTKKAGDNLSWAGGDLWCCIARHSDYKHDDKQQRRHLPIVVVYHFIAVI